MKFKQLEHPKLFIEVLEKNDFLVIIQYKSNNFDNHGKRQVQVCTINLNKYSIALSDDYSQIIHKLNQSEYRKIDNYIMTQKKILTIHTQKKHFEACEVVKSSILLMESFKKEFKIYGF